MEIKGYKLTKMDVSEVYDAHTFFKNTLKVGKLYCIHSDIGETMLLKYEGIQEYVTNSSQLFSYTDDTPNRPITPHKEIRVRNIYTGELLNEFKNVIALYSDFLLAPAFTLYKASKI